MAKYILVHDLYIEGTGHFKKSRGNHDWRDLPAGVTPPKSAKPYGGSSEKPLESKEPPLPGFGRTQTVEEILVQKGVSSEEDKGEPTLAERLASRDTKEGRAGGKK